MKIRFGEVKIGEDFEFAGKTLTKLDKFNAVTKVSRGKQTFLFFNRDIVSVNYEIPNEKPSSCSNEPVTTSPLLLLDDRIVELKTLMLSILRDFYGRYTLSMKVNDQPMACILHMDEHDLEHWVVTLEPYMINNMVVRSLEIRQSGGVVSLYCHGSMVVQKPMPVQSWKNGDSLTVIFNN